MEVVERNWAELPQEILHLIVKKLPEVSDFIRSRTICKPWRSSISVSDQPPQFLPWIFKLGKGPDSEFYSIASNKVYTIHAPNSSGKELFGPASCYLLACQSGNGDQFSLLNPLNNSEVFLPVEDAFANIGPLNFQGVDYVVVEHCPHGVVICKAGCDKWDSIRPDHFNMCFYLKGLLYSYDIRYNAGVIDIGSRKEVYVIPPPKDENFPRNIACLVESRGEIFRVCAYRPLETKEYEFDIHRLELGNGTGHPCWAKVRSIRDQVMFLDFTDGLGVSFRALDFKKFKGNCGFCVRAHDFSRFKGNCIYYIQSVVSKDIPEAYEINMYDIENGSTISIGCPFDRGSEITWFMPTLNHS